MADIIPPQIPRRFSSAEGFKELERAGLQDKIPVIRIPGAKTAAPETSQAGQAAAQYAAMKQALKQQLIAKYGVTTGLGLFMLLYPHALNDDLADPEYDRTNPAEEFSLPPSGLEAMKGQ